jgi:glycine cleavage system H protein
MSKIPNDLKYTKSHEWVRPMDDGTVLVGITDHAQELLGDMVYVELPEVSRTFKTDEECAIVESVKAAADVYCPLSGEITEVNGVLVDQPEIINGAPYDDGWMFRLRLVDRGELDGLLDGVSYQEFIESEQV